MSQEIGEGEEGEGNGLSVVRPKSNLPTEMNHDERQSCGTGNALERWAAWVGATVTPHPPTMKLLNNISSVFGSVSKRFRRSDGAPHPPPPDETPPAQREANSGRRGKRDKRRKSAATTRRRRPVPSREFLWNGGTISYSTILVPTALTFARNVLSADTSSYSKPFLSFLHAITEAAETEGLAYAISFIKDDRAGLSNDNFPHRQDRSTYDHVTLGLVNIYQIISNRTTKLNLTCLSLPLHLDMDPSRPVFASSYDKISAVVRAAMSIVETADRADVAARVAILAHRPKQYEDFDGRRRYSVLSKILGSNTSLQRIPGVYSNISFMSHDDFANRYRDDQYTHAIYLDPAPPVRYRGITTITVAAEAKAEVELGMSYGYFIGMERARQQALAAMNAEVTAEIEAGVDEIMDERLSCDEVIDLASVGDAAALSLTQIEDAMRILAANAGEVLVEGDFEEVWSPAEYIENRATMSGILLKLIRQETLSKEDVEALDRLGPSKYCSLLYCI